MDIMKSSLCSGCTGGIPGSAKLNEMEQANVREPNVRRYITSFKIVESGTPWYGSMHLDELNRTITGRPGFEHFEQSN